MLLEALALAPPLPKLRPIQLPLIYTKLRAPPRERSAERSHAFRLWPRTKPHPARIRLLGKPQSRAELDRDALYQAQLDRLKRARLNRPAPVQLMLRRLNALSRVLEKPLPYAKRLARKLRRAPKTFLAKIALKRQPRSPYVDPRMQRDTEIHVWPATRAPNTSAASRARKRIRAKLVISDHFAWNARSQNDARKHAPLWSAGVLARLRDA